VVLDTNVWISAALAPQGAPASVVRRALEHARVVMTPPMAAELESRLWKPKFDRYLSLEDRRALVHDIRALALWVDPPAALMQRTFSRDPQDDMFIHAALAAQAHLLITGDQDLLVLSGTLPVSISSPADALAREVWG
jgi:putative PIN family toxin of toxin-antitoxin system